MQFAFSSLIIRLLKPVFRPARRMRSREKQAGSLTPTCFVLLSSVLLFSASTQAEPAAGNAVVREYRGSGEIFILTPAYHTVVVDVAEGNRKRLIGGKLAVDAILLKEDTKVDLRQFQVGEKVRIAWRETDRGKEILTLISDASTGSMEPSADEDFPDPFDLPTFNQPNLDQSKKVPYISTPDALLPQGTRTVPASTLIGAPSRHQIGNKETLLDIARAHNLGYNELIDLYPDYDPWLPPVGRELVLPTTRILPDGIRKGIVINVPELRLYYFTGKEQSLQVTTHPVGIGDTDFQTPPGMYSVGNKRANPTWYIPPSLIAKYKVSSIPPGPDNPLGKYWIGLKDTMYGIHGTDIPWAVGRTVTHGCIRMYPEDIERFFPLIPIGTPVQIVYEPVKIAEVEGQIYVEIHKDIYQKIPDLVGSARQKAIAMGVWPQVDRQKFMTAVEERKGIPVNVTGGYSSDGGKILDPVGTAATASNDLESGKFPQDFP